MTRLLSVALLLAAAAAGQAPSPVERQPNIVLVLCDDMGFSDLGCYGGEVDTPTLDRLAAEGARFTQFYNNAKCTTTRASIVTGRYPRRGKGGLLRGDMATVGEVLRGAGYRTVLSGKWHLGHGAETHPHRRGFDEFYGLLDGCCNFFDPARPDPDYKGGRVRRFGRNDERIEEFPEGYYTTDAFTDHAIECIERFAREDAPFFLHVCYTAPHYPLHAKPDDIARYRGRYAEGWDALRAQRYERQQEIGLLDPATWPLSRGDSRAYDWEDADQDFEDHRMAVYAAMIDSMDRSIGRLMRSLEEAGVAEDTLVLFLSDNGGCAEEPGGRDPDQRRPGPVDDYVAVGPAWGWAQNAPFRRYKSWVHEGGITTPLIAWWPGRIEAGTWNREPAHIIDLLPTFAELADADAPVEIDGRSMVGLLTEGTREPHAELAWEWAGNRALRQGDWKVVWDRTVKAWELYDLSRDRTETRDLAREHPERVAALSAAWFRWAERTGLPAKQRRTDTDR
ncbi:MAG: arylsulfatase [Planctomycetota bacterium]